jgi:ABC-type bacteriocin/lantibiotic exporter with double-glycine peptidase domain
VTNRLSGIALAVALLVLPCPARSEVNIAPECRVKNCSPGRCGWCSVETLARHHKIRALFGLTDDHASNAAPDDLTAVLDKLRVCYRVQKRGERDTGVLRAACKEGLGAVVGFRPAKEGGIGHIVTLVDFGDETVKVIDPDDEDGRVRSMAKERFLTWWDGFTLVLEPQKAKKK